MHVSIRNLLTQLFPMHAHHPQHTCIIIYCIINTFNIAMYSICPLYTIIDVTIMSTKMIPFLSCFIIILIPHSTKVIKKKFLTFQIVLYSCITQRQPTD